MREPENMPGTVLAGRYQLDAIRVDATGSSTSAMQFDATDVSSQEAVSVRIVALSNLIDPALGSTTPDDALAAYESQVDIAASLRHPCIESVLDHGEVTLDGDRYVFTVGERLAGGSLREFLDRGRRLTPSQALIVGIDACRGLDAAAKQESPTEIFVRHVWCLASTVAFVLLVSERRCALDTWFRPSHIRRT